MTHSSLSSGRFTSGVVDGFIAPRIRRDKPLVVACHGAGITVTAAGWLEVSELYIVEALAAAGYPVVIPTLTDLWGNATATNRVADAITWGRANLGGNNDPVVGLGGSAGMISVLHAHDITPMACAVGIIPALDMENLRDTDAVGVRSEIDTAWGVTYPAALPAGANPAENTSNYTDLPMQLHYSTTDAVTLPISTTDFATATGAELVDLGTNGHTEASVAAVDHDAVVDFVLANT